MSVAAYFEAAARHAEVMLRAGDEDVHWSAARRLALERYQFKACALATRALTRAMVKRCTLCEMHLADHIPTIHKTCGVNCDVERLHEGEAATARWLIDGWLPSYQNDVPGQLRTFAWIAREHGW